MSEPETVACPICGNPYTFYPFMAGDQSACPSCREKARATQGKWLHSTLRDRKP